MENDQPQILQQAQIAEDAGNLKAAKDITDRVMTPANYTHMGAQFSVPFDPAGGTE